MGKEKAEKESLADIAMAHRYLYYVLGLPVISDREYDQIEREARETAPHAHGIHGPGSDLSESYSSHQISIAGKLISK